MDLKQLILRNSPLLIPIFSFEKGEIWIRPKVPPSQLFCEFISSLNKSLDTPFFKILENGHGINF